MARTAKRGASMGKTPSRGTFIIGTSGKDKTPLGGIIHKGKDLRGLPGKNQGGLPRHM